MTLPIPLILLPGLLCDETLWAPQIRGLAEIAVSSVADVAQHETMAEIATSVLATAPDAFALAGLSMGGYIAHEIMRQAPERIKALALLDTSARTDTAEQARRRRGLIQLAQIGKFKGVTPRLLPMLVHEDRLADSTLTDKIMDMAESIGKEGFLRQQKAILSRPDSRPNLENYTCPTLIVAGRQDALTPPEMSEEMAGLIPGARLEILEDCGHLSTLERPEEVTDLMRQWLAGLD